MLNKLKLKWMAFRDIFKVINEFIYDSFLFITLGSFGIAELGKIFGNKSKK